MKKRIFALILAAALALLAAVPAMAAAPAIHETEYKDNGVVEVEFNSENVRYRNLKVTVKDADGAAHAVTILEKDRDDLKFSVADVKAGARYSFTISGVRDGTSGSFGKVKGTFRVPSNTPKIKKVEYDAQDRELDIEFATRVQFRNLKVVVSDDSGKKLTVSKLETGRDDIEVRVRGIKAGKKYTVTVSGVRVKGIGKYTSATKKFTAR